MLRTRSKASVQADQPLSNPHTGERIYDIITVKATLSTGSVPYPPLTHSTTGNQEQAPRNSAKVANYGDAEQVEDARPRGENGGAKLSNAGEWSLSIYTMPRRPI